MSAFGAVGRYVAKQHIAQALAHRDFRIYCPTHWFSAVGYWVERVAIGWLTWELTHSGAWLGIVAAAEALPFWLLVPIAGAVADRVDRLRMFRNLQFVTAGLSILLAVLVFTGEITVHLIAAIVFVNGCVQSMLLPVRFTIIPNLVPRKDLASALALHSILFQLSVFIGPAIAGILITTYGVGYAFVFHISTYVVFIGALLFIRLTHADIRAEQPSGILAEMWAGMRYVALHRSILPMLALVMAAAALARPYLDLMPGFADAIFGRGAEGLATLVSAAGIGGMAAGLAIAQYGRTERMTVFVFASILTLSVATFLFATTNSYHFAIGCVVVIAAMLTVSGTGSQILIQNAVEGAMRGRVMSIYGLTWRAAPALGALAMGALSTPFGLQAPLAAGAVLCLVVWLIILPKRKTLVNELEAQAIRAARGHAVERKAAE